MNDGRTVVTQYHARGELEAQRERELEARAERWGWTELEWLELEKPTRGGTLRRLVGLSKAEASRRAREKVRAELEDKRAT